MGVSLRPIAETTRHYVFQIENDMKMPAVVERRFEDFLRAKVEEANSFKYVPTKFLGMLSSSGAYATTTQLLSSKELTSGYQRLWENGRLDLSVEALVLEHEWREYFDPMLLQRAEARLREFNYIPKTPTRRSDLLVSIEWPDTVEHIPLNLAKLKSGEQIQTVERSKSDLWCANYDVNCADVQRTANGWVVVLAYEPKFGGNAALARRYPQLEWGRTVLEIDADLEKGSAEFSNNAGQLHREGLVTFLETSLYQTLTRAQVGVLLRPGQAAVRKKLLEEFGRCAISNESCAEVLEVAHIVEHSVGGAADVSNAILLRADIHNLFDSGLLSIDETGAIALNGVADASKYRAEIESGGWNRVLAPELLISIKRALKERASRSALPVA